MLKNLISRNRNQYQKNKNEKTLRDQKPLTKRKIRWNDETEESEKNNGKSISVWLELSGGILNIFIFRIYSHADFVSISSICVCVIDRNASGKNVQANNNFGRTQLPKQKILPEKFIQYFWILSLYHKSNVLHAKFRLGLKKTQKILPKRSVTSFDQSAKEWKKRSHTQWCERWHDSDDNGNASQQTEMVRGARAQSCTHIQSYIRTRDGNDSIQHIQYKHRCMWRAWRSQHSCDKY